MTLLTTNQIHVLRYNGQYYNGSDAIIDYAYLTRYLTQYDDMQVLVRTRDVDQIDASLPRVDGDRVKIVPVPDPQSLWQAMMFLPELVGTIRHAARESQACFLKMPDVLGALVGLVLLCLRRAYAVEVVCDSYECIRYAKKNMLGHRLYARFFDRLTRVIVARAGAVAYISRYLQRRYPHANPECQFVFCSVEIDKEDRGRARPSDAFDVTPFQIVAAGRLSAEKGHAYLIRAMKHVVERADRPVVLDILGEGPERPALEGEAKTLGLENHVRFKGFVKRGAALNHELDQAQLYVLPSLTEGMGRGLIEAMARGIPCLGTTVGGVPEFLDAACLVRAKDAPALADKILAAMSDPERLAHWSAANLEATVAFSPEQLEPIQNSFWSVVSGKDLAS